MRGFIAFFLLAACLRRCCNARFAKHGVGAVVSNGNECAPIGRKVLIDGGNAVDAAIAVLLCEGVTGPQNNGIGGGFLATVYIKQTNEIKTVNAREAAPKHASTYMFKGLPRIKGGIASAIPSELKGYWEMKQQFGSNYPWQKLFEPTIKLCKEGYKVDSFLARILMEYRDQVLAETSLKAVFVNPTTNDVYKEGEIAERPELAETLKNISLRGPSEFYDGLTGQNFIDDVQAMGGILTMEDLRNYKVKILDPVKNILSENLTLYSTALPGSGVVLSTILELLKNRLEKVNVGTRTHRIIEAFKHAYGFRSHLADPDFEPSVTEAIKTMKNGKYYTDIIKKIKDKETSNKSEYYGGKFEFDDHGTSNIAIIDKDGNAIVATSTINNVFGAFVRSLKTGIILNDEMDDFSTPGVKNSYGFEPSEINFIKPGKQPMSSMSPTIILDKQGNVRLLIGGAGGSLITTSVALTIIRHLYFQIPLYDAINNPRIHHQLVPMHITVEKGFGGLTLLDELRKRQHEIEFSKIIKGFNAVTGISVENGKPIPVFDQRRGGSAATTE